MKSTRRPRDREGDVLSVFCIDKADAACPGAITPDLASFLYPVTPQRFITDFYQKQRALAVKVHPALREQRLSFVKSVMDNFNPRLMLAASNSNEGISVWMKPAGGDGNGNLSSVKMRPDDALVAYNAGMSLYFRAGEAAEAAFLPAFMQQLGFGAGTFFRDGARRAEIEVFASHVGHVTNPHFDFQTVNFTIQLRGRKAWTLTKSKTVPFPAKACAAHFVTDAASTNIVRTQHAIHQLAVESARPGGKLDMEPEEFARAAALAASGEDGEIEGLETVVLEPGDILYHPAGVWHKVETLPADSNSLSINMSLFPMSMGELVQSCVETLVLRTSNWRRPVSSLAPSDGVVAAPASGSGEQHVGELRRALQTAIAALRDDLAMLDATHVLPEAVTQPEIQGAPREIVLARFIPAAAAAAGSDGDDGNDDDDELKRRAAAVLRVAKTVPASRKLALHCREQLSRVAANEEVMLRRNPLAVIVELNPLLDTEDPADKEEDDDGDEDGSNSGDDDDDDSDANTDEDEQKNDKKKKSGGDRHVHGDDCSDSCDDDGEDKSDDGSSDLDGDFLGEDDEEGGFVCFDLTSNIASAGAEEGHFGAPGIRTKLRVPSIAAGVLRRAGAVEPGKPVAARSLGLLNERTLAMLHVLVALGFFSFDVVKAGSAAAAATATAGKKKQ
jgi:hypothetical protein